jgi:DMSO/TMAO reductase YedYZ molybdopterin-dependent catalytic subunit
MADPAVPDGRTQTVRTMTRLASLSGALAAAVALGVGELVAAISEDGQSLVISVDNWIIQITPGDAARTGIDTFGSADKPLLIWGTVVIALFLGALLGRLTLKRTWVGGVGFGIFALIGALAGRADELAPVGASITAALIAGAAGAATLYGLLFIAGHSPLDSPPVDVVGENMAARAEPMERPTELYASRRAFFGWAGAAGVVAAGSAGLSRSVRGPSAAQVAREEVMLTGGSGTALPVGLESEVEGLSRLVTPNETFYRIDTALIVPQVDPDHWVLSVTGLVDEPYELNYTDLLDMADYESDVTLSCVSNEVGGRLVGNARWQGVRLSDILERAGVRPEAEQVVGRSVDGWDAGFPIELAFDGRPTMVAIGMNGEPLPINHGFPARLVVAGIYGYVSATKWLSEIELTTWDGFDGYWVPRGWSKLGPIKTESRIDVPRNRETLSAGTQPVAGVAWAGDRGVEAVEISVDEGPWLEAQLSNELAKTSWRQWVVEWDAEPGDHRIQVRATDGDDETQTEERVRPDPDGATGWHTIAVTIES